MPLLKQAIRLQHGRMDVDLKVMLQRNLRAIIEQGRPVTYGSACSGSEVAAYVLECLAEFWDETYQLHLDVDHLFACEIVDWKQTWILNHFAPKMLFSDVMELHKDTCKDVISGDARPIPDVDIFMAGFECDSVSGLNNSSKSARGCLMRGEGKTGSTGMACLAYIEAKRPRIFALENVKNLGAGKAGNTDLDHLVAFAKALGYAVKAFTIQALDYGCPQSRCRYYVIGVRVDASQQQRPWSFNSLSTALASQTIEPLSWAEFQLIEDTDEVQYMKTDIASRASIRLQKQTKDYEVDHMQAFQEQSLQYPPTMAPELKIATASLGRRMSEKVYLFEHFYAGEVVETVHDLNLSHPWSVIAKGEICPCVVSTSRLWFLKARREVSGPEALSLQGFDFHRQNTIKTNGERFNTSEIMDLSGNAFCGYVVASVLTSIFTGIEWAVTDASAAPASAAPAPTQELDMEADHDQLEASDDELESGSDGPQSDSDNSLLAC